MLEEENDRLKRLVKILAIEKQQLMWLISKGQVIKEPMSTEKSFSSDVVCQLIGDGKGPMRSGVESLRESPDRGNSSAEEDQEMGGERNITCRKLLRRKPNTPK